MNWKDLATTIGKVAPTIGGALAGNLGASVGNIISSALGVDNTPDAVKSAIETSPEALLKIVELEKQEKIRFEELAVESEKNTLNFDSQNIQEVNQTIREESKSEHWVQYTWRPFIGFSVGISTLGGVVITLLAYIGVLVGKPEGVSNLAMILGSLAGLNATVLPILGIASYFRGKEKLKGFN